MTILNLLAQTPPPTTGPTGKPPWADLLQSPMMPLMLGLLVLFVIMSRSKKKQERQRKSLLDQLKKGDRVVTIGGEIGTVVEARENEVVLKVDETSNTKIHYLRSAIHRLLEEEKAK